MFSTSLILKSNDKLATAHLHGLTLSGEAIQLPCMNKNGIDISNSRHLIFEKLGQILLNDFKGSYSLLVRNLITRMITSPLVRNIDGVQSYISMHRPWALWNRSLFETLRLFVEDRLGIEAASTVEPFHLSSSPAGTYTEELKDKLVKDKGDKLLNDIFKGDLGKMISNARGVHLRSPLEMTVLGEKGEFSLETLWKEIGYSPYLWLKRYLVVSGEHAAAEALRGYHCAETSRNLLKRESIQNELILKAVDYLLISRYDGDLQKLIANTNAKELFSDFSDRVGSYAVPVSIEALANKHFKASPFRFIKRYLQLKGLVDEADKLRSYHLARAGNRLTAAEENEKVIKKGNILLKSHGGDFKEMAASIRASSDVLEPFIDQVGIFQFEVSMSTFSVSNGGSPHDFLRIYCKLTGRKFNLTRKCLLGTTETRVRHISGALLSHDRRRFRTEDGIVDLSDLGFKSFNTDGKEMSRQRILCFAKTHLGALPEVRYLGLETEKFQSLRLFSKELPIAGRRSLVVEADPRVESAMRSISRDRRGGTPAIVQEINIQHAKLEKAIDSISEQYDLINLDFIGHLSRGKKSIMEKLITKNIISANGILAVTIDDSPLGRSRALCVSQVAEQLTTLKEVVMDAATASRRRGVMLDSWHYSGGTSIDSHRHMLVAVFSFN